MRPPFGLRSRDEERYLETSDEAMQNVQIACRHTSLLDTLEELETQDDNGDAEDREFYRRRGLGNTEARTCVRRLVDSRPGRASSDVAVAQDPLVFLALLVKPFRGLIPVRWFPSVHCEEGCTPLVPRLDV